MFNQKLDRAGSALCVAIIVVVFGVYTAWAGDQGSLISHVSVSRDFFVPSAGQTVSYSFDLSQAGILNVMILDPDGVPVRTLVQNKKVEAGKQTFNWDATTDLSESVSGEAYSMKIDFASAGKQESYFPANKPSTMKAVPALYYDRGTGTLSYQLQEPSRVHIEAGYAKKTASGEMENQILIKTISNYVPRAGGKVIEHYMGYDESGTIRIADHPDFVVAIAAIPLPENSVIVVNPEKEYIRSAAGEGKSLFTFKVSSHKHHQGLSVLEGTSPSLKVVPANGAWVEEAKEWRIDAGSLEMKGIVSGPSAGSFIRQKGRFLIFIDGKLTKTMGAPTATNFTLDVPVSELSAGKHEAIFDSISDSGPAAAYSFRFSTSAAATNPTSKSKETR